MRRDISRYRSQRYLTMKAIRMKLCYLYVSTCSPSTPLSPSSPSSPCGGGRKVFCETLSGCECLCFLLHSWVTHPFSSQPSEALQTHKRTHIINIDFWQICSGTFQRHCFTFCPLIPEHPWTPWGPLGPGKPLPPCDTQTEWAATQQKTQMMVYDSRLSSWQTEWRSWSVLTHRDDFHRCLSLYLNVFFVLNNNSKWRKTAEKDS